MTDTSIRAALLDATEELVPPADLLSKVRAGGHRRVVRRRTLLAAGLATITAGGTAGVLLRPGDRGPAPVASPLLDGPTRGDLAGHAGFLADVRATWLGHVQGIARVGAPHVVWAGLAPHAGRAAVVAQRVPEEVVSPAGQIRYGLLAFVEETPAGLRAISLEEMLTGATTATAAVLTARHNVLMVLDDGRGVDYSPAPRYTAEGTVDRSFRPLDFRTLDGVAFEAIAPWPAPPAFALRADAPDAQGSRSVGLANLFELVGTADPAHELPRLERTLAGGEPAPGSASEWDLAGRADFDDPYGYRIPPSASTWFIRGVTPDRRRFVVQTLIGTDGRSRVLLSLGRPDPVLQAVTDPAAALPVGVRLPDGQGVVIAAAGAGLRYRVARGGWLPVNEDAALVPAAAEEVEVTPPGGRAMRVRLP